MRRLSIAVLLSVAGCASEPPSADLAQRELARQDFESLGGLAGHPAGPEILPAQEAAGYAYQIGLKYPVSHILSSSWSAAFALPADVVVTSLAPIMGSSVQDAVEGAAITASMRGASFDRLYESIPAVNPDEKDLYLRDRQRGPPGPLRLERAAR